MTEKVKQDRQSAFAQRLEALFVAYGDVAALDAGGTQITWDEIGDAGQRVLDTLALVGAGSGTVGLVIRTRPDSVAAFLALLRTGRPVALINYLQGATALADELRGLRLRAVVMDVDSVEPAVSEALDAAGTHLVSLQGLNRPAGTVRAATPVHDRDVFAHDDTVAYSITTSGTTGRPKRIPVPRTKIAKPDRGTLAGDPRQAKGATINTLPFASIGGAMAIVNSVWRGRPLAIMDRFDVREWAGLVRRYRPRIAGAPPAVARMVIDAGIDPKTFEGVRCFYTGSAPMSMATAQEFERIYHLPVLQSYGASEFLGPVARHTMEDWDTFGRSKLGSVGRPIPGKAVEIVDPVTGQVLPPDHVGTVRVAVLTADEPPQWVSTNDLGRLDADGFLWIQGRTDDVLMRGGFKVSRGDVAAVLNAHDAVAHAVCLGLGDERLGQVPAAAVEVKPESTVTAGELLDWCRQRLKKYEIPVLIDVRSTLPRNEMMKLSESTLAQELAAKVAATRTEIRDA
ncbi:class I adenylate-forming enzyme family protein [Nakamurella lactea]|uniref:class I adenylate-forming enzyme family protein n=1 Tax=Nakamurella lactea TaxID=459515 RepID=UPI000415B28F|nr:class I adenylate-forming enzyme family protein [Nakamurella lactea]